MTLEYIEQLVRRTTLDELLRYTDTEQTTIIEFLTSLKYERDLHTYFTSLSIKELIELVFNNHSLTSFILSLTTRLKLYLLLDNKSLEDIISTIPNALLKYEGDVQLIPSVFIDAIKVDKNVIQNIIYNEWIFVLYLVLVFYPNVGQEESLK